MTDQSLLQQLLSLVQAVEDDTDSLTPDDYVLLRDAAARLKVLETLLVLRFPGMPAAGEAAKREAALIQALGIVKDKQTPLPPRDFKVGVKGLHLG